MSGINTTPNFDGSRFSSLDVPAEALNEISSTKKGGD